LKELENILTPLRSVKQLLPFFTFVVFTVGTKNWST